MGVLAAGQIVIVPFPYTDLTGQKLRPALVLASAGRNDWIICQITSNPYADPLAIELTPTSFAEGSLRHTSYARPSKLFTAHESLIAGHAGLLKPGVLGAVHQALIQLLQ